jgi:hypothetical protein
MKSILLILLLALSLLTACSSTPSGVATQLAAVPPTSAPTALTFRTPTSAPDGASTTQPNRAATVAPTVTRAAAVVPTLAAPVSTVEIDYTELPLGTSNVRIYAVDLLTLAQADFTLSGQAPEGTVVSVNDDFVVAGADQKFVFQLKLQEGPNLIEIEVSNAQGEDNALGLVLIYDPSP